MDAELMQQYRRRRRWSGRGSAWQPVRYRDDDRTTQRNEDAMMPLTPGGQIDELRRLLKESEQRRQAAEQKLADRERQLGAARQSIAAQDHRIEIRTDLFREPTCRRRQKTCFCEPAFAWFIDLVVAAGYPVALFMECQGHVVHGAAANGNEMHFLHGTK